MDTDNNLYLCQTAFDAASEEDALNTTVWGGVVEAFRGLQTPETLDIVGIWDDGLGGTYDITPESVSSWGSSYAISQYNNVHHCSK